MNSKDVQNSFEGWSACNEKYVCSKGKLKKVIFSGGAGGKNSLGYKATTQKEGGKAKRDYNRLQGNGLTSFYKY